MVFLGSKNKYKNDIPPIINKYIKDNNITTFVDCFCGGANLTDKIICDNIYAIDLSPTLISLHKAAQEDFSLIPEDCDREKWDSTYAAWKRMKKIFDNKKFKDFTEEDFNTIGISLHEIGCVEWYASYSRGGFPRGYAKNTGNRNYYKEARKNHKKQSENEIYKKINFICDTYENVENILQDNNALLYCDAPYKDTTEYAISKHFNYFRYYNWLKEISKKYPVFVSEQYLPPEFDKDIVWSKDVNRTCGKDHQFKADETLWLIDNRSQV